MSSRGGTLPLEDLTVGIATYNGADYVTEAVESALAVGARVIISDDVSQDGTREVLRQFSGRARVVQQQMNLGIGANYQYLLDACETSSLLLLNQDDVLCAESLDHVAIRTEEVTVFNGWVLDGSGRRVRAVYRRPPIHVTLHGVHRGLSRENFIRSPSQVVFPVEQAREAGGFIVECDAGQGAEDWMCWLRLAAAHVRFTLRMRPCVGYRVHPGNYSHNSGSLGASRQSVRERLPPRPERDARLRVRW